jgi:lipoprotein-anchoring transpeptidase ErfK/SrfK
MNPNQSAAFKNIEQAQQALKSGDRNAARQFAVQAARLAPEMEEVWLMMGALASPRGSVAYLERALQINPQSERAQKGLLWARARLLKEANAPTQAVPPAPEKTAATTQQQKKLEPVIAPAIPATAEPRTDPIRHSTAAAMEPKTQPRQAIPLPISKPAVNATPAQDPKAVQDKQTNTRPRSFYFVAALLVLLVFVLGGLVLWKGPGLAAAFINGSLFTGAEHGPAWAQANLDPGQAATQAALEATAAPAGTDAGLATDVPELAIPTSASSTPIPEATPLPTETSPAATETSPAQVEIVPTPTATVQVLNPVLPSPTQELAASELASPTPLPTDTGVPLPTQYAFSTPKPSSADAGGSGRWIDVDLTHQMVYAYEGNTLVNSFVVSTGTWQHPTVTGQYHVYVKFRYKDMSGPGYYLPNVPFTMFFYQGYAIHGTYWHSNFGTPMSHGCVNLSIPDSEWVYNWASVGTLVNVHY